MLWSYNNEVFVGGRFCWLEVKDWDGMTLLTWKGGGVGTMALREVKCCFSE